jgi:hypothetical protein
MRSTRTVDRTDSPSACDAVLKTPDSKLEVLIGCKTIAALPK